MSTKIRPAGLIDDLIFGENVIVYCTQHCRPHFTGWCTVHSDDKEVLDSKTIVEAYAECREKGMYLHDDEHK